MDDLPRFDERNAQKVSKAFRVSKGKQIIRTLAVELPAQHPVDVRKDLVHGALSEVVERRTCRNNTPEQGMVVLNVRFLVRSIGIAEKQRGFFDPIQIVFKS